MKSDTLGQLNKFERELKELKAAIKSLETQTVGKKAIRDEASRLASYWIDSLCPALRHSYALSEELLQETTIQVNKLFILSRPNNLATSYLKVIDSLLKNYKNKFVLPIQQNIEVIGRVSQLDTLIERITSSDESTYIQEAIDCAKSGYYRAAIVLGWCAVIDRFQRKITDVGFDKFNAASLKVKNITTGKFKRWNKEFNINNLSELQAVFDNDLITVLEGGLGLIDSNQAERLEILFTYRNQSAHPGNAPIDEPHLVAFFYDIVNIVFTNPVFKI